FLRTSPSDRMFAPGQNATFRTIDGRSARSFRSDIDCNDRDVHAAQIFMLTDARSGIVSNPAPDLSDPANQTHLCDWRRFSGWWLFAQIPDLRNLALRFLASFEQLWSNAWK